MSVGRSASPYTHSARFAKNARRSSTAAIVHACLARATPRARARPEKEEVAPP
jgi:hypothetical protein